MRKKILIVGDSFAADWSIKFPNKIGWPNLLATCHDVTNLAQAGVSEYKILQQVKSAQNLQQFDLVIVSHTSPYRVYTKHHPVHANDQLHKSADLILNDIYYHHKTIKGFFNRSLNAALGIFKYHFDDEYLETTYQLIRQQISTILKNNKVVIVSGLEHLKNFSNDKVYFDYSHLMTQDPENVNHCTWSSNQIIFQDLQNFIANNGVIQ